MEKSHYYISCTGNICLTIPEDNPKLPPRLYIVDGIVLGMYDVLHFHMMRILPN